LNAIVAFPTPIHTHICHHKQHHQQTTHQLKPHFFYCAWPKKSTGLPAAASAIAMTESAASIEVVIEICTGANPGEEASTTIGVAAACLNVLT
jgi:hypothetical protein